VSLIGSSLGAYLAALYAARHREVERVVLMAPAFEFARRWRERLGEEAMRDWGRSGFLPVFHYGAQREDRVSYALYQDGLAYEGFPRVSPPVLLFQGLSDDFVPPESSREFVRRNPHAVLRELDSDHELMNSLDLIWAEVRLAIHSRV